MGEILEKDLFVDVCRAADLLGVSIVTARKLLGKPDKVIQTKYNLPHHLYSEEKLKAALEKQGNKKRTKCEMCRRCHIRKDKTDLVGGRCQQCRADLCVLNFCRGNCITCGQCVPRLLDMLKTSIAKAEASCRKTETN